MGGWALWTTAEPRGTPKKTIRGNYAHRSIFFAVSALSILTFPLSSSIGPIYRISAVSKRLVLVGGRGIGARRKASGPNGPPRNLATPHGTTDNGKTDKMSRRANWRNPTGPDGTQRDTNRGSFFPGCRLFSGFAMFGPSRSPPSPPPSPNTRRVGGFETPDIGFGGT